MSKVKVKNKLTIYTSLDGFKSKYNIVKSYTDLGEEFVEWINNNTEKLLNNRNSAELIAERELKEYIKDVEKQVFFKICNHSYFLDYYIPSHRLAIEIDGGYHKLRKTDDKLRDSLFREIGIRTIRIKSKDVLKGNFIKMLKYYLIPKKKRKKINIYKI